MTLKPSQELIIYTGHIPYWWSMTNLERAAMIHWEYYVTYNLAGLAQARDRHLGRYFHYLKRIQDDNGQAVTQSAEDR
jgi:hypothetical protein